MKGNKCWCSPSQNYNYIKIVTYLKTLNVCLVVVRNKTNKCLNLGKRFLLLWINYSSPYFKFRGRYSSIIVCLLTQIFQSFWTCGKRELPSFAEWERTYRGSLERGMPGILFKQGQQVKPIQPFPKKVAKAAK